MVQNNAHKTLSATFWEEMINMAPADLQDTLDDGLSQNPEWIIDQAICASKNVRLTSEEFGILTAFCNAHYSAVAERNLSLGINAAITGLQAFENDEAALHEACDNIVGIFENMAFFNREKAMDSACAQMAWLGDTHLMNSALTNFLVGQLREEDAFEMFKYLSRKAAEMSPEHRMAFVRKVENVQRSGPALPSGAFEILQNVCLYCAQAGICDDPAVNKACDLLMDFEEGETVAYIKSAPEEAKKPDKPSYIKEGNLITLHPKRDP